MAASPLPTVVVVGALPPPVHGAAQVTAWISQALAARARVVNLDTAPRGFRRGVAYHLRRALRVLAAIGRLVAGGFGTGAGAVYVSAAGGAAAFYDMAVAAVCRCLARPLYLHHHSFAYVDRYDRRADLLARLAGPRCRHICLCPRMADGLARNYSSVRRTLVLSNAAFPVPRGGAERAPPQTGALRIGHLSNLCHEKGLDMVIETFAAAGDAVDRLVLAGAPVDREAEAMLEDARRRFGSRMDLRGPVAGADKVRFFADIDVFLFPTRYVNEAEPLVVIEALAAGVPVITYGRGCIPHMVPDGAGIVVPPDAVFAPAAVAYLARLARDGAALGAASARAAEGATEAHDRARPALTALLEDLAGAARQP